MIFRVRIHLVALSLVVCVVKIRCADAGKSWFFGYKRVLGKLSKYKVVDDSQLITVSLPPVVGHPLCSWDIIEKANSDSDFHTACNKECTNLSEVAVELLKSHPGNHALRVLSACTHIKGGECNIDWAEYSLPEEQRLSIDCKCVRYRYDKETGDRQTVRTPAYSCRAGLKAVVVAGNAEILGGKTVGYVKSQWDRAMQAWDTKRRQGSRHERSKRPSSLSPSRFDEKDEDSGSDREQKSGSDVKEGVYKSERPRRRRDRERNEDPKPERSRKSSHERRHEDRRSERRARKSRHDEKKEDSGSERRARKSRCEETDDPKSERPQRVRFEEKNEGSGSERPRRDSYEANDSEPRSERRARKSRHDEKEDDLKSERPRRVRFEEKDEGSDSEGSQTRIVPIQ